MEHLNDSTPEEIAEELALLIWTDLDINIGKCLAQNPDLFFYDGENRPSEMQRMVDDYNYERAECYELLFGEGLNAITAEKHETILNMADDYVLAHFRNLEQ